MSRRKSEVRYKPVEHYAGTEAPQWTDVLRGCMIALIEQQHPLWDARFRSAKERILDHLYGVGSVLQNQDNRMNEWAILEKWCWMMEMYARAVEFNMSWRYTNSMNFLNSFAGNGNVYLGCLSKERFVALTHLYGTVEEQAAITMTLTKKNKRFATGTGLFLSEMAVYASIVKDSSPNSVTVPVVSTHSDLPTIQIIASPSELLPATPASMSKRTRAKSGRSSVSSVSVPATTLAEMLAMTVPITTSTLTTVTPKQDLSDFSSPNSAFSHPKVKIEEVSPDKNSPGEWKPEAIVALIDAIRLRPVLWNLGNANFKLTPDRRKSLNEVTAIVEKIVGITLTEGELTAKWSVLRDMFTKYNKKTKSGASPAEAEFFTKMQFLAPQREENGENAPSTSAPPPAATAVVFNGDDMEGVQTQLKRLFGSLVPVEPSPREAKRPRVSSPTPKKNEPQVVATWVPPKEDALANAFAAAASSTAPTATAQVVTTSGTSLTALFETPRERKSQVNGVGKRHAQTVNHETREEAKNDKWVHLGRLVEQTCRDLEGKNEELAVNLQKELGELLCKYQLKCIKKS